MKGILPTLILIATIVMAGCGEDHSVPTPNDSPSVSIDYQDSPLADVHVRLHAMQGGPVVSQAVTAADGRARFVDLPSPEPESYFVTVESLGDGGWILDPKLVTPAVEAVRLKPFSQVQSQSITLPPRSVKSLYSLTEKGSDPLRRGYRPNDKPIASKGSGPFSDRLFHLSRKFH